MSAGPARLEVVQPGAYASIQDGGRRGLRRVGVPWAGVLDPRWMRVANALAGNDPATPVIEAFDAGLQLAADGAPVRVAVAGHAELEWQCGEEQRRTDAWRSFTLAPGDRLRVRRVLHGRMVVVAVQGLAVPAVLGSASTYARAGLGGVDGRPLAAGVRLAAAAAGAGAEQALSEIPPPPAGAIRAVPGPQDDHFDDASVAAFAEQAFTATAEADRMGVRLQGPPLVHRGAPEIVSDATVPGSVQVPGNGQPIVLLADAQTAGGYPKIATVIGADLPRVAQLRPGETVRFAWVDAAQGEQAARAAEAQTRRLVAGIRVWHPGGVDLNALYTGNLIDGVVHALSSEPRPHP